MKKIAAVMSSVALVLSFMLITSGFADAQQVVPSITAKEAAKYAGKKVTVCGTIKSALCTTEKGQSSYLNLDAPYPQDPFAVRIAGEDCQKMNLDLYKKGTNICVTGVVELSPQKKPYIQVTEASQIQVKRREKSGK